MEKDKIKILEMCAVGFTVQNILLPLIDELTKYEFDVTILCSHDERSENLKKLGYKIKNIEIARKVSPIKNIVSIWRLTKYLKQEKFDCIHLHTPVAAIIGRIAAFIAKVPVVVYTAHGFYFHDEMSHLKKKIFMLIEKIGGYICNYVFTVSSEDYKTAIEEKIIPKEKITFIGNGIDVDKYNIDTVLLKKSLTQIKKELNIPLDNVVVGIVGRMVREKGFVELALAANEITKRYTNVIFLFVGDTLQSDRDGVKIEIDRLIQKYNLQDKVIFTGDRSNIPELLATMDIFTLPSHREGMPLSLLEAMSMSKCTVATNIRGCREEVIDNITGFLVPVRDHLSLAGKIQYLIENPRIREQMGKKARELVLECFDQKPILKRQVDMIKNLIIAES